MPVVPAGSNSLLPLEIIAREYRWEYHRLPLSLLLLLTLLLAGLFFRRKTARQQLARRLALDSSAEADIACTAGSSFPRTTTIASPLLDYWLRRKLGQGRLKNWHAKLTVSRGGTALAGPGGAPPRSKGKSSMEEEERSTGRTCPASRSRGVSTHLRAHEVEGEGRVPLPDGLLDHVKTPVVHDGLALREHHQRSMGNDRFLDARAGLARGPGTGVSGQTSTSFFGHHMMDDEHILYGSQDPGHSRSPLDGWPPITLRSELGFTRLATLPLGPPASAARPSLAIPAHGERTQSIAIPARTPTSGSSRFSHPSEVTASPSSYPPTSPLLPPPPATTYEAFDPAAVMFPGPARDGGIRMVPVEHGAKEGPAHVRGQVVDSLGDAGLSWKRHTRVYGGGVCLACVAAAGEGGFYGDSVRPEDKR